MLLRPKMSRLSLDNRSWRATFVPKKHMSHVPWPEIEGFHNVRKLVQAYPEVLGGRATVSYRAKVKLHGTNGAVQVRSDGVFAQSRERMLTPGNDNMGFARWVEAVAAQFCEPATKLGHLVFFGEWCGPGIMKSVAVNKISSKVFAVFAAARLPMDDESELIVEPAALTEMLAGVPGVHILPWYGDVLEIPLLETPEVVQPILDSINASVAEVEACDPWVKATFGIEGTGEGLVYYPLGKNRKRFSDLVFKAKGEKHKVIRTREAVQLDPEVASGIDQFATLVLTDARLEQGARSIAKGELVFDKKLIGPFLAWIGKDVEKETAAELEASKLTWKQVQKTVSDRARRWYLEKTETL